MAIDVNTLVQISRRWENRRKLQAHKERRPPARASLIPTLSQEIALSFSDTLTLSESVQARGGALATSRYRR